MAQYVRENNIPYLGICLGMQIAAIELHGMFLGLEDANSTEFEENTKNPVIYLMPGQRKIYKKAERCVWVITNALKKIQKFFGLRRGENHGKAPSSLRIQ